MVAGLILSARRGCFSNRRKFLVHLGLLLCVSALLLPAISVTDDLHYTDLVFQDTSSTKRLSGAIANLNVLAPVFLLGALLLISTLGISRLKTWRSNKDFSRTYREPLLITALLGRAPPPIPAQ